MTYIHISRAALDGKCTGDGRAFKRHEKQVRKRTSPPNLSPLFFAFSAFSSLLRKISTFLFELWRGEHGTRVRSTAPSERRLPSRRRPFCIRGEKSLQICPKDDRAVLGHPTGRLLARRQAVRPRRAPHRAGVPMPLVPMLQIGPAHRAQLRMARAVLMDDVATRTRDPLHRLSGRNAAGYRVPLATLQLRSCPSCSRRLCAPGRSQSRQDKT